MFEKLTSKFSNLNILSYKKFIIIILLAAIFIGVAVVVYRNAVKKNKPLSHVDTTTSTEKLDDKHADLYLFYTEWCPHCKKTKPEWAQLKKNYENDRKINGYTLNFIEVDCEANPDLANKFNISGYPTIKLVKGNQVIEFDAKPDVKTLETFLSTVLAD